MKNNDKTYFVTYIHLVHRKNPQTFVIRELDNKPEPTEIIKAFSKEYPRAICYISTFNINMVQSRVKS